MIHVQFLINHSQIRTPTAPYSPKKLTTSQYLFFLFNLSISSQSSRLKTHPVTSKFYFNLSTFDVFGIIANPCWIAHLNIICGLVLLYFSESFLIIGVSMINYYFDDNPISTYEAPPIVEYDVIWTPLCWQNFIKFFWVKNGCNYTWFTTGFILDPFIKSLKIATVKLLTPIFLINPSSTSYSIALHVSSKGTLSTITCGPSSPKG